MLEATASYEWFVKLVEPLAGRVLLAHPRKMRIIAESTRKSDKVDARVLAEFLALDMIPPAHRPTPRQRAHRKLVRRRVCVRARLTSIKNRIRHVAAEYNADRRDLFTSESLKYLRGLKLDPVDRWLVQRLLRELKLYRDELKAVDRQLAAFARTAAGRRSGPPCAAGFDSGRRTGDARDVPGGGRRAGAFRLAEEADQLRRPAPGQRESAGRRHDLGITHSGSPILLGAAPGRLATGAALVALATDLRAAGPAPRKEEGHYRHRAEAAVSDAGRHPQRTAVPRTAA
ncbi:MAG: transposase [Phycisphaerales bacterium]|nr:transposase [Phycisphaerales bacterium]